MFIQIIKKDLSITLKKKVKIFNLLFFFILTVSIFPLTLPAHDPAINMIGTGVIWIALLLSSHISMSYIYEDDFEDGSLEQLFLTNLSPFFIVLAKILANFISTSLLIVLFTPISALLYNLSTDYILSLVITMFFGGLILNLLGSMGAAITVGLKKNAVLSLLLISPLYIPTIIFGVISSDFGKNSLSSPEFLTNFGGLLVIFFVICPVSLIASTYAIKAAIEE